MNTQQQLQICARAATEAVYSFCQITSTADFPSWEKASSADREVFCSLSTAIIGGASLSEILNRVYPEKNYPENHSDISLLSRQTYRIFYDVVLVIYRASLPFLVTP